jgi:DNA-binding NarL/FixJ family response regulator
VSQQFINVIRVVLADDHIVLRMGIRNLLSRSEEITVIGEAGNGIEALRQVAELQPDVLILDMEMPELDGPEVARRLRAMNSPVRILALSAYNEKHYILSMLEQGAAGYLIKDEAPEVIVEAVRGVARGEQGWLSRKVAAIVSAD